METKSANQSVSDAAIIRRQLLWTLAIVVVAGLGYGVWWWGQDTGWGNPDRAVATKMDQGEKAFVAGHLEEGGIF